SAAARRQLASFWGAADIGGGLAGPVALPSAAGPEAPAEAHADDSPALRQAQARVREGEAAVRAAEAGRRPDITVSAGMKREADTRDESLLFGVSVPLPLFDRQQGALRAARAELVAAQAGLALARQQFGQAQDALLLQRDTAWREAAQLRDEVLPVAGRVLAGVREGYRAGKFSLLELLDAQRSLMSDREAYLAARQSFHQSDAALDELLGRAAVAGDAP
ncbi:TolC family protein, partial [Amnimonas aquatica]